MDAKSTSILIFITLILLMLGIQQLKTADSKLVASRVKKLTARDIKKKLSPSNQKEHKEFWRKILTAAGELFIARRLGRLMDKKLEEADVLLKGQEFVVIVLCSSLGAAFIVTAITLNPAGGLLAGIVGGLIPFLLLSKARAKRLNNFNAQISDALTIMSNSLRSGFSFLQSMDMVRKELPDPIRKEFSRTFREINLGTTTEEALQNMARRIKSEDLDLVITAVLIQRQVGGNLAEVLDNIAETIRERIRIKREVKTLTAQGRISGVVIAVLPVLLAAFMFIANPSYIMELFTNQIGLIMLAAAITGEIIGMLLIKKIVNIKV
ncbi:tight adherence protein B [Desulfohalotomaculum tongense]|uniref:type II secretion system F family protein n=1 Tax=Desulforadius tongensis TaxID=1216062 RepID=UPI00195A8190|nr:type II secretion system F family protein [Desulforadius tongensis]MBM7855622.1 tight adherence protein B [Desulforadius tongensis]